MSTATCHFCNESVELEVVCGEVVMKTHFDSEAEFCEGSGERPIVQREITD